VWIGNGLTNIDTGAFYACTKLGGLGWYPVRTNTLTGGSAYFNDPQWRDCPGRFYRLRSP
jgi:hypothetical protein